jgi:hypothetical protein
MRLSPYSTFSNGWWRDITIPRNYKRFVKRVYERARYGISYEDSWDLCSHLDRVIVKGIENLKDMANGYPMSYDNIEDWHKKLDEIANGIAIDVDLAFEDRYYNVLTRSQRVAFTNGMQLFREQARLDLVKHWDTLWD